MTGRLPRGKNNEEISAGLQLMADAFKRRPDPADAIAALDDTELGSDVRWFAARALGRIDTEESAAALLRHIDDPSEGVRGAVARSLGRLRVDEARDSLLATVEEYGCDSASAYHALGALAELREKGALPYLDRVLRSPIRKRRLWAARCSAKIGGDEGARLVRETISRVGTVEGVRLRWILWTRWAA